MDDDTIDTSDIAPLDDALLARAPLRVPREREVVTVHIDPDVATWDRAQGTQAEVRMRAALRIYAEAHGD
jgi:uncharacterized protein (DUF4415 family)